MSIGGILRSFYFYFYCLSGWNLSQYPSSSIVITKSNDSFVQRRLSNMPVCLGGQLVDGSATPRYNAVQILLEELILKQYLQEYTEESLQENISYKAVKRDTNEFWHTATPHCSRQSKSIHIFLNMQTKNTHQPNRSKLFVIKTFTIAYNTDGAENVFTWELCRLVHCNYNVYIEEFGWNIKWSSVLGRNDRISLRQY